jgi:hypothetical protein
MIGQWSGGYAVTYGGYSADELHDSWSGRRSW